MYPGVICSAVHAATRCAFAITTLHPGSNLKNLVYEEGKKRGSLQQDASEVCLYRVRILSQRRFGAVNIKEAGLALLACLLGPAVPALSLCFQVGCDCDH